MQCVLPTQNQLYAYYISRCNFHQVSKPSKAVLELLEEDELSCVARLENESAQIGVPVIDLARMEMHNHNCHPHLYRCNHASEQECVCRHEQSNTCPLCAVTSALAHVSPLARQRVFCLPLCNPPHTVRHCEASASTTAPSLATKPTTTVYLGPRGMMALLDLLAVLPLLEVIDLSNVDSWYARDAFLPTPSDAADIADMGETILYGSNNNNNDENHCASEDSNNNSHKNNGQDGPRIACSDDGDIINHISSHANAHPPMPSAHRYRPYSGNAVTWRLCQVVQSLRRVHRVNITGQPVGCEAARAIWQTVQTCPQLVAFDYTTTAVEQRLRVHIATALRHNANRPTEPLPQRGSSAEDSTLRTCTVTERASKEDNLVRGKDGHLALVSTTDHNNRKHPNELLMRSETKDDKDTMGWDDLPTCLPPCLLELPFVDRKTVRQQQLLYQLLTHHDNFAPLLDMTERKAMVQCARVMTTAEVVLRCRTAGVAAVAEKEKARDETTAAAGGLRGDGVHLFVIQCGALRAAVDRCGVVLRHGDYFGDTYSDAKDMQHPSENTTHAASTCAHSFSTHACSTVTSHNRAKCKMPITDTTMVFYPASPMSEEERGFVYAIPLTSCAPLLHRWRARVRALYPLLGRCVPVLHAVGVWTRLRACTCATVQHYSVGARVQACGSEDAECIYVVIEGTFATFATARHTEGGIRVACSTRATPTRGMGSGHGNNGASQVAETSEKVSNNHSDGGSAASLLDEVALAAQIDPCANENKMQEDNNSVGHMYTQHSPPRAKRRCAVLERYDVFGFEAAVSRHKCSSVETIAGSGEEDTADSTAPAVASCKGTPGKHGAHVCACIRGSGTRLLIAQLRPVLSSLARSFSQHDDLRLSA